MIFYLKTVYFLASCITALDFCLKPCGNRYCFFTFGFIRYSLPDEYGIVNHTKEIKFKHKRKIPISLVDSSQLNFLPNGGTSS